MMIGCLGRISHLNKIVCNANSGSDSRVHFQNASPSQGLRKKAPDTGNLWNNGAGLSNTRTNRTVTSQAPEPTPTIPDRIFEGALAPIDPRNVARTARAVVLAGGETKNPLTRYRAMPSIPIGSCLTLVDIPINNCLRSGINKIYVITQFQSHALNSHIASAYPPVRFSGSTDGSWVDVLAAQQTVSEKEWYRGSADAIRRNINELKDEARGVPPATDYVILSGAAVYNLDIGRLLAYHRARDADITLCTHLVEEDQAVTKGIVRQHHSSGRVLSFEEKPSPESLSKMKKDAELMTGSSSSATSPQFLANMGIYVFKRNALFDLLAPTKSNAVIHIGHHLLPSALAQGLKVYGYQHHGFWSDVSSLKDYYEANLAMAKPNAPIKMAEIEGAAVAKKMNLPPALLHGDVFLTNSLIDDGAVLVDCTVSDSVIGQCIYIGRGSVVEKSLLLGSPFWTNSSLRQQAIARGERVFGVGDNCVLKGCVVDENASIGDNVHIVNREGVKEADRCDSGYMIQDGIVVVLRNAQIESGTVI